MWTVRQELHGNWNLLKRALNFHEVAPDVYKPPRHHPFAK